MGIVYHWVFFSSINPAAKIFGVMFFIQGILFIYDGVIKNKLSFLFQKTLYSYLGLVFILFGMVIYPLLGYFLGHLYPSSPTFGLPCPTTIFTFGVFLLANKLPKYVVIIPFIWAIIGFMAAVSVGVKEDTSLLIVGIIGFLLIMFRRKSVLGITTGQSV